MACCIGDAERRSKIAHLSEMASPGLKEILLKLYRAEKPMEMDHHLYEFGCVEYHIKSTVLDSVPKIYVSIATPIMSRGSLTPKHTSSNALLDMVEGLCPGVVEIVEPPIEGYDLTLQLNFANIPRGKDSTRVITTIAAVQSVIASSRLKEILRNFSSADYQEMMPRPIKLVYHPREPFFITKQEDKITALLPMRFKEATDVVIAASFFQELVDVGSTEEWAKAPRCTWSPIPPPELRGESMEDLSTNGGFISFDIYPRHVHEKRLDKTVWNILNFYALVKSHVKSTKGFVQRKLRKRLEELVKSLDQTIVEDAPDEEDPGCGYRIKVKSSTKLKKLKRRCSDVNTKIKRIRYRIKIRGFGHLRRRWFSLSRLSSNKYMKLDLPQG